MPMAQIRKPKVLTHRPQDVANSRTQDRELTTCKMDFQNSRSKLYPITPFAGCFEKRPKASLQRCTMLPECRTRKLHLQGLQNVQNAVPRVCHIVCRQECYRNESAAKSAHLRATLTRFATTSCCRQSSVHRFCHSFQFAAGSSTCGAITCG